MTWLDRFARAQRPTRPVRSSRFRPALEQLQHRDVPSTLAGLSGFVYVDANNDGVFDASEAPISGVTVTLTGTTDLDPGTGTSVSLTTTTDATGAYKFENLLSGTYTITESQPAGYLDGKDTLGTPGTQPGNTATAANDVFGTIRLDSGVTGVNNIFGERLPAPPPPATGSLGGVVYSDCNKNGKQDAGETGIAGVTVTLTGPGGTRTATTDASGRYAFSDLISGTYTVTESQPAGYQQGTNAPGTPTNGMVNGDVISGVVVNGTALAGYNFGEIKADVCPKPPVCDPKPPVCDPKPPVCDPTPPVVCPKPPVVCPAPPVCTPTPPVVCPKPPVCDPKPPVVVCPPKPPVVCPTPTPVQCPVKPPVCTPTHVVDIHKGLFSWC